jgi:hypothetical protein
VQKHGTLYLVMVAVRGDGPASAHFLGEQLISLFLLPFSPQSPPYPQGFPQIVWINRNMAFILIISKNNHRIETAVHGGNRFAPLKNSRYRVLLWQTTTVRKNFKAVIRHIRMTLRPGSNHVRFFSKIRSRRRGAISSAARRNISFSGKCPFLEPGASTKAPLAGNA